MPERLPWQTGNTEDGQAVYFTNLVSTEDGSLKGLPLYINGDGQLLVYDQGNSATLISMAAELDRRSSVYMANGADSAGAVLVATAQAAKATAGIVTGWHIYNPNDEASFVHFYNVASGSVTVGTTVPRLTLSIAAGAMEVHTLAAPITFSTAITIAATEVIGDGTAPDTGLHVVVFYE